MKKIEDVIKRPLINEKSTLIQKGSNQYMFEVDLRANKQEIAEAVSKLFHVKVLNVNTSIIPGKKKRFGRIQTFTNKWKRAIVTLAKDEKIDFFGSEVESEKAAEA